MFSRDERSSFVSFCSRCILLSRDVILQLIKCLSISFYSFYFNFFFFFPPPIIVSQICPIEEIDKIPCHACKQSIDDVRGSFSLSLLSLSVADIVCRRLCRRHRGSPIFTPPRFTRDIVMWDHTPPFYLFFFSFLPFPGDNRFALEEKEKREGEVGNRRRK